MNQTLEEIGKTLFKCWFVDFEFPNEEGKPYKSSGGEMVNSELGEIPRGWEVGHLRDIFEINTKSVKPQKKPHEEFWHFSIPSYDQFSFPTKEKGEIIKSNKTAIHDKSILVSKLNPKKEKRIWSVLGHFWNNQAISSTEFINYVPLKDEDWAFGNFLVRNDDFYNSFSSHSTGSTGSRQRVRPSETLGFQFTNPQTYLKLSFKNAVNPLLKQMNDNIMEIMSLINLRDSLLPRLMSGKLRVN